PPRGLCRSPLARKRTRPRPPKAPRLNCRNCMTRVTAGMRRCPSCGRDLQNAAAYATSPPEVDADAPALVPGAPRAEGQARAPAAGPVSFTVEPAEVRALVASSPEWIEPGLRVHGDGVNFQTPVGAIDLLAQDDA